MFLNALATATPPKAFAQSDCWRIAKNSGIRRQLRPESMAILKKVLLADNGIRQRYFAVDEIEHLFDLDADTLNRNFERAAPLLASEALQKALSQAGLSAGDVDGVFVCTCTGYLCPGVTSYLSELMNLRPDAHLVDLVGLGCGAAIPMLRTAAGYLAANPDANIACIAVEICSAAFFLDDDPGVLISACLFGDGAAATIWSTRKSGIGLRAFDFDTLIRPADRDLLRFEMKNGKLRNRLQRTVPSAAAQSVSTLYARNGTSPVEEVIAHPGGRDVLTELEVALPNRTLPHSTAVLSEYGNMSSPSVLFALDHFLAEQKPEHDLWLVSFGAGFSAHACRLGPPSP
jgi:alkylresorcinol/alkylpyrone synthase